MNKVDYSLGVNIAESLKQQGFKITHFQSFIEAFHDLESGQLKLSAEEVNSILSEEFQRVQAEQTKHLRTEGDVFLAENAKRQGVTVLPSGLQYEVIIEGNGRKPKITDQVTTHYHGSLPNGKVFDSSVQRGQPATFPLNGVIKGWTEALQLMNEGSKYRLFIPSDLAYGERGAGNDIGPHQALVFEVELIKIES
jgi:FKBP-type peptidyl-prolyl cis-trans isomerase FklB